MKFLINHIKQQYHIKDYKFGLIISVVAISVIDYKWIMNFYWILYVINLILLIAVKIPGLGHSANGAQRWINLGFMQLQPSDLTKILLIIFFARFFSDRELKISSPKVIIQSVALLIPSLILIVTQPNLSTTICIAALFCALIFLAGLNYKFVGKGYNNDATTSVKNGNFVSEPQTDFIFAIIGEELGFVGCCGVIFLLLLIVIQCILIGLKAKDTGGRIICGGVAALIGIQSFINISVATLILPNTGLSLPFVSYGLTSVVCFFMGIGLVLNVGLQPNKYQ